VAALVASFVPVSYDAITPGSASNVNSMIGVPSAHAHQHRGGVLLVDVNLVQSLRAIQYAFFWLNNDNQLVPSGELTGSATATQYQEQGVIDMATAREAATVVALQTAGYRVSAAPNGVVNYQPLAGSPGATALKVGDVITAIDDRSTLSFQALDAAVAARAPGERVTLDVHFFGAKTSRQVKLRLGELRGSSSSAASGTCVPFGSTRGGVALLERGRPISCIGLYFDQLYKTVNLPFSVNLNSEGIIGPSAGLAFTLGLLQKLDPLDLTGGHLVAATGTMSVNGQVGDVGGVAQKTVAVRNAGAVLFLVPPQEYAVAKAHAGTRLKVVAVSTIGQAIAALKRIGGHIAGPTSS
jgi:PDZ domain-containing protein